MPCSTKEKENIKMMWHINTEKRETRSRKYKTSVTYSTNKSILTWQSFVIAPVYYHWENKEKMAKRCDIWCPPGALPDTLPWSQETESHQLIADYSLAYVSMIHTHVFVFVFVITWLQIIRSHTWYLSRAPRACSCKFFFGRCKFLQI